ncbi:MAG: MaoC/PaaZ C-terminal domain-containing protein [Anaerolineae bacterium]
MRYTEQGPKGYFFEESKIGDVMTSQARTITEADIVNFGGMIGDYNPLHFDAEFMKNSMFGKRIAHGMLTLSFGTGLVNMMGASLGTVLAFKGLQIEFKRPVFIGDTIRVRLTVIDLKESSRQPGGWVTHKVEILNQNDEVVQEGEWSSLIAYRPKE